MKLLIKSNVCFEIKKIYIYAKIFNNCTQKQAKVNIFDTLFRYADLHFGYILNHLAEKGCFL